MSVNKIAWHLQKAKALRDYIGRYTADNKTIVQNKVPVGLNVSWQLKRLIARSKKTDSEEQKHLHVIIQTTYVETPSELAQ